MKRTVIQDYILGDKMRLKYFGLGDIAREDEINGLLTIFFSNQKLIKDTIKLDKEGYTTKFGTYIAEFDDNSIDFTYDSILIKNNVGSIRIICNSELNCTFNLKIDDKTYSSNGGVIVIPLQDFTDKMSNVGKLNDIDDRNDENTLLYELKNIFDIDIKYLTPFIKDIKGDDHIINTTEELANIIKTAKDGEEIILSGEILHNTNNPIEINKRIILKGGNFTDGGSGTRIFNVSNIGRLEINNSSFDNITVSNINGGIVYNLGECVINNSNFTNCSTDGNGIIYSNGNLNVKDTTFTTCNSANGGAIFTTKGDD